MIQSILVLGSGSAGLLAAISLKLKIPQLQVKVVRSPELGTIGVGEGTTPNFPRHLFEYLKISRKHFYAMAEPTWKLGIRFLWGPRGRFDYTFSKQLDAHWSDLPRPNGFYCDEEFRGIDLPSALMAHDMAWTRQDNGAPDIQGWHGFHIENKKLIDVLETVGAQIGLEIIDGKVNGHERGEQGIKAVILEDGRRLEADFFIDSSGFRSELLGKALEEPFVSFDQSLFCDRAVVGGWERGPDEPILPYTTAETMNAGWSWQIEHEFHVNRGYVYASGAISDDQACGEFLARNPKAPKSPRVVKFRSGHYRRLWVDNVVAIGNAGGFVEPLEATALMVVCSEVQTLIDLLQHSALSPTPTMRTLFNNVMNRTWEEIRDFLALHYKVNTMKNTPFWRQCREDTDVSGIAALLEFYKENGPTGFGRHMLRSTDTDFGMEGYLVMLVGNQVAYQGRHQATAAERTLWNLRRDGFLAQAKAGMGIKEALAYTRHPGWRWNGDPA